MKAKYGTSLLGILVGICLGIGTGSFGVGIGSTVFTIIIVAGIICLEKRLEAIEKKMKL